MDNGFASTEENFMCSETAYRCTATRGTCMALSVTGYKNMFTDSAQISTSTVAQQCVPIASERGKSSFQSHSSGVLTGSRGGRRPRNEAASEGECRHTPALIFVFQICACSVCSICSYLCDICLQPALMCAPATDHDVDCRCGSSPHE